MVREGFVDRLLEHVATISAGACTLDDAQVEATADPLEQEVLAGLLFLHEDLVAQRAEIERQRAELEAANAQLRELNATLEARVHERTEALEAEVAERRASEARALQAEEAARVASQAKSAFLANMSHEFRTPLNAIIGYSEILLEDLAPEDAMAVDLRRVAGSGVHLLSIVNDVLDFSKIEAGHTTMTWSTVDVGELLEVVADVVRPTASDLGSVVVVERPPGRVEVTADRTKLRQVLQNVASNACKFTDDGTVTLRVDGEDDAAVIEVVDTGVGMSEAEVETVFEAFIQAESANRSSRRGTGLGLSIAQRYIEMMGGTVHLESTLGEGTRVVLRVPLASRRVAPADGSRPTVLVVDDDPSARDLLRRCVERSGFGVVEAGSGAEALAILEREPVAAMTLDLLMPGVDGHEVLSTLRRTPALAELPVVLVSTLHGDAAALPLGADGYLQKPVDRKALTEVLNRLVGTRERSVLVIDDDPDVRALVGRTLQRDGWSVQEAQDGRLGWEVLQERLPGVVLLDLMMPDVDGFELVARMARDPRYDPVPVLVFTAKDLSPVEAEFLHTRVYKVLAKGGTGARAVVAALEQALTWPGRPAD